ncbi:hypothetical protein HZ326_23618 [Fusarium oxysporum f. sp. albedinis]|nr:hypothetical protein HZ326_23618 [Fusarium oxysporum f. sp. albedinis]
MTPQHTFLIVSRLDFGSHLERTACRAYGAFLRLALLQRNLAAKTEGCDGSRSYLPVFPYNLAHTGDARLGPVERQVPPDARAIPFGQ